MTVELHLGDCLTVMRSLDENSVDTCITDPPYELGFMGKRWDSSGIAFQVETWQEVYRVLKPGALLLAFGGTRTYHRMVCAIEDAGFEIRDTIAWVYGSGFPKSYNIGKGIDKQAGVEREVIGRSPHYCEGRGQYTKGDWGMNSKGGDKDTDWLTAPSTPEAQLWDGWGTALKPAFEPIVVAMKPVDGTFVNNALTWGVAGLWIDGGRVEGDYKWRASDSKVEGQIFKAGNFGDKPNELGRFPANFIHDGSDEVLELFPETGKSTGGRIGNKGSALNMMGTDYEAGDPGYGDSGSAARFFYCAKASRSERNAGLEGLEEREWQGQMPKNDQNYIRSDGAIRTQNLPRANFHPTVKPISLMRYLVRLTKTPTGGVVLDPFTGSGSTGCACVLEGRDFIGIDREQDYIEIADKRIEYWARQPKLELT